MSAHLSILSRAGLVVSHRQGRSIIYRANLSHMQEAIRFLVNDCCAGHPTVCGTLADEQLINAMMAEPIVINRPIVVTHKGTRLCRHSETLLNLPDHPVAHFVKEDGENTFKVISTNEDERGKERIQGKVMPDSIGRGMDYDVLLLCWRTTRLKRRMKSPDRP